MLEILDFRIGGFFSGVKQVKIWYEDGKLFRSYSGDLYDSENTYSGEVADADTKLFEAKLEELKISKWKEEYVDPSVLDGTHWSLVYKEAGKRCRQISGSNGYPECWKGFIETLGMIVPEILREIWEDEE